jgi:hypothetical protein
MQLKDVFWQSIEQKFKPDVDAIRRFSKDVKAEIHLAKELVDHQEYKLQMAEREAASKQRLRISKFILKSDQDSENIHDLRLQQSLRHSSKKNS